MGIDDISTLFDNSYIAKPQNLLVEENDPNGGKSPYKEIAIKTRGYKYLTIRLREGFEMFPFFHKYDDTETNDNPPEGLLLMCDYLLFAESTKVEKCPLYVILVELKGSETSHARKQLESGKVFWEYIYATAKRLDLDFNSRKIKLKKLIIQGKNRIGTNPKPFYKVGDCVKAERCNKGDTIDIDLLITRFLIECL